MEPLKNHKQPGFLLMEVLLTIALVGMSLAPAFVMQSSTMRNLYNYSARLRLFFPIKNFWLDRISKLDPKLEVSKEPESRKITRPSGTLTYKLTPIGENSAFKKIKGIHRVEVVGRSRRTKESLVSFIYRPEKKKK